MSTWSALPSNLDAFLLAQLRKPDEASRMEETAYRQSLFGDVVFMDVATFMAFC